MILGHNLVTDQCFDIQVGNWIDIFCHPLFGSEVLHQADKGDEDLQHHHFLHSLFTLNK